ncbi:MAG: hypothetical protein ABFD08_09370 [Syntrophomonas sp.]
MHRTRIIEDVVDKKTQEIKRAMASLGKRLEQGDESQILHWVIDGRLACAHRPLRHHRLYGGSGKNLAPSAADLVRFWGEQILIEGVRSVISLMHDRDLACYTSLDLGTTNLLEYYKSIGLEVAHVPWEDPHHKRSTAEEKKKTLLAVREEALTAYDRLKKPVMVQCSAGIDRSSPVAAFIWSKRQRRTA